MATNEFLMADYLAAPVSKREYHKAMQRHKLQVIAARAKEALADEQIAALEEPPPEDAMHNPYTNKANALSNRIQATGLMDAAYSKMVSENNHTPTELTEFSTFITEVKAL